MLLPPPLATMRREPITSSDHMHDHMGHAHAALLALAAGQLAKQVGQGKGAVAGASWLSRWVRGRGL